MTDTITSSVPGAIEVLFGHLQDVAAANPSLNAGVYMGIPIEDATNNFMMIGDAETGELITGYSAVFAGLPATSNRTDEQYAIIGTLRAYDGGSDPIGRLSDAFLMLNGITSALQNDIQASGAISPSGSWKLTQAQTPSSGPFSGKGWGVLITFAVEVLNVRLTS